MTEVVLPLILNKCDVLADRKKDTLSIILLVCVGEEAGRGN
jgi:hypothetical protein